MEKQIGLETQPKVKDLEEENLAYLKAFRVYLRNFAIKENDPILLSLNFDEISEEDMGFFRRFQMGMFDLAQVERQEKFLSGMREGNTEFKEGTPLKEADTSLKLLAYMRSKLTKSTNIAA